MTSQLSGYGKVCGVCRAFNEITEDRCCQCNAVLILGLDPEQAAHLLEESPEQIGPASRSEISIRAWSELELPRLDPSQLRIEPDDAGPEEVALPSSSPLASPPASSPSLSPSPPSPAPPSSPRIVASVDEGWVSMQPEIEAKRLRTPVRLEIAKGPASVTHDNLSTNQSAIEPRDAEPSVPLPGESTPPSCPVCQIAIIPGHQFCGNCGTRIISTPEGTARPSSLHRLVTGQPRIRARLVLVLGEGDDSTSFQLRSVENLVGRTTGGITFPDDEFLSPRHATFSYRNNRLYVRDEGSLNGIFIRIRGPVELTPEDYFLAGEELLRFEPIRPFPTLPEPDGTFCYSSPAPHGSFRIIQTLEGNGEGLIYCARTNTVVIGRENADINFPTDRFLSRHHSRVERTGNTYLLADMGSKNGTYIRFTGERELQHNDYLFLGKNLLRVDIMKN